MRVTTVPKWKLVFKRRHGAPAAFPERFRDVVIPLPTRPGLGEGASLEGLNILSNHSIGLVAGDRGGGVNRKREMPVRQGAVL